MIIFNYTYRMIYFNKYIFNNDLILIVYYLSFLALNYLLASIVIKSENLRYMSIQYKYS